MRGFSVWFAETGRWDVAGFINIGWHWPDEVMRPLGEGLTRIVDEVASHLPKTDVPIIEKITFGGDLHITEPDDREGYKGRLFWARPGNLVYSKIRIKQGSVTIVPQNTTVAVSAEYPVYAVNEGIALAEYLNLVLRCSAFQKMLDGLAHGGSTKTRIHPEQFESLTIPFPPLDIQRAIVQKWRDARDSVEFAKNRIRKHERTLLANLLYEVGIEINITPKRPKVVALNFRSMDRWGVEFNRHQWTPENLLQSTRFVTAPLSELAWINPSSAVKLADDSLVSFIPMEAVSDLSGEIITPQIRPFVEVRNGYTRFVDGDVIWAKITPCMQNGKSAVARGLQNGHGFGSTEFHVIRVKDARQLKPEFVWALLRLEIIREAAQRFFIGSAGQQRVPTEFLEALRIPIPPIDTQEAILEKINIACRAIAYERNSIKELSERTKTEIEAAILGGLPN